MLGFLNWVAAILIIAASTGLILSRDWRWSLAILAFQYLGVFWLVQAEWPTAMAAIKLVTGWMAAAALGITQVSTTPRSGVETTWPEGRLFRLFAAGLVILTVFAFAPHVADWLGGGSMAEVWGSLILIEMGLLHLGITSRPLRVTIALLTILSGFEILYAAVEGSILVTALLVVINLGLALAGSYIITILPVEETQ